MGWVREGSPPAITKVSFAVSAEDHPELAAWIWSLPYRKASSCIRDVLEVAAKAVSAAKGDQAGSNPAARSNTQKTRAAAADRFSAVGAQGVGVIRHEPQRPGDVSQPASAAVSSPNVNEGTEMSDAVVEAMSKLDGMFPP